MIKRHNDRGITLLIAIIITGTLLLVALGIANISRKESILTSSARSSQLAFYAADTGVECALFWDVKNPTGYSAFATTTTTTISCNQTPQNLTNPNPAVVGGNPSGVSTFGLTFLPNPYCTTVVVTKDPSTGATIIDSHGYNTCDTNDPRRVERAVKVTY
ncbi:MAG: seg [Parcubacteria group bacterium]|nr:seg [Parcubacteria group bacterium]